MKNPCKKLAAFSLALVMSAGILAGCGTPASQSSASTVPSVSGDVAPAPQGNADRENVTIRYSQPGTPLDNTDKVANDPITKALEEAVNIKLDVDSSSEAYPDRMQTELAAGIGPDLFPNWNYERSVKWIQDEIVTEIGSIINADPARYPILHMMINSPDYKMYNEVYSGDANKTYAIYALGSGVNWPGATLYHREALEAAGYTDPPKTFDDFVDYATKVGATGTSAWWPRNNKLGYWHEIDKAIFAPNGTTMLPPTGDSWKGFIPVGGSSAVEGEWKLMTTSDETKEALKILAQLYKNGGVDMGLGTKDDFAEAKVEFQNGQIGAFNHGFSNWPQVRDFVNEAVAADPTKTWEDFALGTLLKGDAGQAVDYSAPFWMGYHWFIPESCKNPDRVLDFVEYLATDAGQDLLFKGVEGLHYTQSGGEVTYNKEAWLEQGKIYNIDDGRFSNMMFSYVLNAGQTQLELENASDWFTAATNPIIPNLEEDSEFKTYITGVIDSYKSTAGGFLPPYFTVISLPAEFTEARTKMNEITLQYVPAFITGQKNIDAEWANYVAEYERAGSKEIEAAFNTAKDAAQELYESLTG